MIVAKESSFKVKPDIRVLLVEDDKVDSASLQRQMEKYEEAKFQVTAVPSLDQALQHWKNESFDFVVLDLSLPDSQGGETIRKSLPHFVGVPVLILTGNRDKQLSQESRKKGVYAYLNKDEDSAEYLPGLILRALEERRNMRAQPKGQALG
jgi:two-component system sensor histidine kinase UhpB